MLGCEHPHGGTRKLSLQAIGRFVTASENIRVEAENRQQRDGFVEQVLVGQGYVWLGKAARGLVRRSMLIALYTASGRVQAPIYRRRRFPQRYPRADIELLAAVDEAHETLSGPVTRRILGFHADNGSAFIHKTTARLLDKLRVEQTRSRPRQSGGNGLVETKNGAVIRKHIG
jgi:hypothetical protein